MMAFDVGDEVQWPNTSIPASPGQRSVRVMDREVLRHRSGKFYVKYLYDGLHERMIEDMHSNISEDFDNIVAVVGSEGVGKSNEAYHICKSFDPEFDPLKSCMYSWDQFIESVTDDPQKVYWFDEAILVASGRDWMKEPNKLLMKSLAIIRSMNLTIVMCVPVFSTIDVYIRLFRTRYLVKVQKMRWKGDSEKVRGYAELMVPKTEEERAKLGEKAGPEDYFRSVGYFKFPRIEGEDKEIYDQLKSKGQKDAFEEMRNLTAESSNRSKYMRDKRSLASLLLYCTDVMGMSYQEAADVAGMPYSTVKNMVWKERNRGDNEK